MNNIASEDVSDIFFTKAFVGEKKKEIAAESLFNEGNEGKKWRANLFTVNNENEILVRKKCFTDVVAQSLEVAMSEGIFTFLPEVKQDTFALYPGGALATSITVQRPPPSGGPK